MRKLDDYINLLVSPQTYKNSFWVLIDIDLSNITIIKTDAKIYDTHELVFLIHQINLFKFSTKLTNIPIINSILFVIIEIILMLRKKTKWLTLLINFQDKKKFIYTYLIMNNSFKI